jgi:hypothetical protein
MLAESADLDRLPPAVHEDTLATSEQSQTACHGCDWDIMLFTVPGAGPVFLALDHNT